MSTPRTVPSPSSCLWPATTDRAFQGAKFQFHGIHKRIHLAALDASAFSRPLAPGASLVVLVDAAALHDLSAGGSVRLSARGSLPFAPASGAAEVAGHVHFESNELALPSVDGARAAEARRVFKRTVVQDCVGAQRTSANGAENNCSGLAAAAAQAALGGDAKKCVFPSPHP
jgi:hypothetical protein